MPVFSAPVTRPRRPRVDKACHGRQNSFASFVPRRRHAQVAELADALDSGSSGRKVVEVRVLSWAPNISLHPGNRRRPHPRAVERFELRAPSYARPRRAEFKITLGELPQPRLKTLFRAILLCRFRLLVLLCRRCRLRRRRGLGLKRLQVIRHIQSRNSMFIPIGGGLAHEKMIEKLLHPIGVVLLVR
jgi:hypothetical protein